MKFMPIVGVKKSKNPTGRKFTSVVIADIEKLNGEPRTQIYPNGNKRSETSKNGRNNPERERIYRP